MQTGIDLTASRTVSIDIVLELGELAQTVEVTAGTPVIETESVLAYSPEFIETLVKAVGAHKVMYGSDSPGAATTGVDGE